LLKINYEKDNIKIYHNINAMKTKQIVRFSDGTITLFINTIY